MDISTGGQTDISTGGFPAYNGVVERTILFQRRKLMVQESPTMAKGDLSVKIDPEVYRMLKTVASWKGLKVSDYLSEIVRPVIIREMAKLGTESAKIIKAKEE